MDEATSGMVSELLKLGLPGIVILALALVAWRLFKLYAESQEKRIVEAREAVKAIESNTQAVESLTKLIEDRRNT